MTIDLQIGLVGSVIILMVIHDFYFHRDVSWFFCNIAIRIALAITFWFIAGEKWAILSCLASFVNPYRISKTMEAYFEKFFTSKFGNKPDFGDSNSNFIVDKDKNVDKIRHGKDKGDNIT